MSFVLFQSFKSSLTVRKLGTSASGSLHSCITWSNMISAIPCHSLVGKWWTNVTTYIIISRYIWKAQSSKIFRHNISEHLEENRSYQKCLETTLIITQRKSSFTALTRQWVQSFWVKRDPFPVPIKWVQWKWTRWFSISSSNAKYADGWIRLARPQAYFQDPPPCSPSW